jgi:chemotaxis protein methyltransferase CheR
MTPLDYDYLQKMLKDRSGLMLSADKKYLLESRLLPLARKAGVAGISELVTKMKGGSESLILDVVEAMTTNETFFFRDKTPFDHFKETVIPELLRARARRRSLRIWCAAASTGQEPYSLAMILKEMGAALGGWRVEIVATDLSPEVLEKSRSGIYTQFEVQRGLPIQLLVKHFTQVGAMWQLNADTKAMVQFRPFNLLQDFAPLGKFDLIFCRNVLIYFDQPTKTDIFKRLAKATEPDGYLFLGAAETVVGLTDQYRICPNRRGIYLPVGADAARSATPSRMGEIKTSVGAAR